MSKQNESREEGKRRGGRRARDSAEQNRRTRKRYKVETDSRRKRENGM
jgi:hypothetical protein